MPPACRWRLPSPAARLSRRAPARSAMYQGLLANNAWPFRCWSRFSQTCRIPSVTLNRPPLAVSANMSGILKARIAFVIAIGLLLACVLIVYGTDRGFLADVELVQH